MADRSVVEIHVEPHVRSLRRFLQIGKSRGLPCRQRSGGGCELQILPHDVREATAALSLLAA